MPLNIMKNPEFCIAIMAIEKGYSKILSYLSEEFKNNKTICMKVIKRCNKLL
jgi:hypothetical protein